ncbi:MAG: hypothetical protein RLZZ283_592 [Candidatus Parcubacteria bacterium]|jgi:hypothetical protein
MSSLWAKQLQSFNSATIDVMPPATQPPIGVLNPEPSHHRLSVFRVVLMLVVLVVIGGIFYAVWSMTQMKGSVSLIVRDVETGGRTLYTYTLSDKGLVENESIDANLIVSSSAKLYQRADGSVIGLTPAGVVMADIQNRTSVLIASTVSPTLRTPLAVWAGGDRIAWMNPADNSVQVFDRSARGTYLPSYLNTDLHPNSLGFTDDGSILVATALVGDTTEIYAIRLNSGSVSKVSTIDGLASIVTTP